MASFFFVFEKCQNYYQDKSECSGRKRNKLLFIEWLAHSSNTM